MGDAVLGEDLGTERRAHEGDQLVAVLEMVLLTDRLSVPADHILGQRVGEVVPVLGVERAQVPVLDLLDLVDVTHGRHCNTAGLDRIESGHEIH